MEDEYAQSELPSLSLGLFGHPGSGRRTLLEALQRALTARGWGTLRHAPPLATSTPSRLGNPSRTITNRLHVTGRTAARRYLWSVLPTASKQVDRFLAGLEMVEAGVLVISAEDGVMPETRAQARLAAYMGVRDWVVVVTKLELVEEDEELLELIEVDARELLNDSGARGDEAVIVYTSAARVLAAPADHDSRAFRALLRTLEACDALPMPAREREAPLWMAIESALAQPRRAAHDKPRTWVAGRVRQGALTPGASVELLGGGVAWPGRVIELRSTGSARQRVRAGEPAEVLLEGEGDNLEDPALDRVHVVCAPGSARARDRMFVEVQVLLPDALDPDTRYREGLQATLHIHATKVACVVAYERSFPPPATTLQHWIWLDVPIVSEPGDRFLLREKDEVVAYGRVIEATRPWVP
ncbi:MAG: hypothetical protein H6713_25290 [Myxococcales bacterium]|nr:hypothetical protein [Myxococcales bacterium]